jgi:(2R)-3-sulfolactate dehydrogenase (NADP+)
MFLLSIFMFRCLLDFSVNLRVVKLEWREIMDEALYNFDDIYTLVKEALTRHKTNDDNASIVSEYLVKAEADGQKGHGLSRVPSYCQQVASGKVNGNANPKAYKAGEAVYRIDANYGFAAPALILARQKLGEITDRTGVGAASVYNSHHCGVAGHYVEELARAGYLAILFANTPKAIAPWGGTKPVYGTNPIAFAAPRSDSREDPVVIDLSLSKVARGKIMHAQQEGKSIPSGWALDSNGNETTNPDEALKGSMVPMGDAKGAALVFMVEILAAALTGANLSHDASSFFSETGPPPSVGQLLISFSSKSMSGGDYNNKIEQLIHIVREQKNVRIPGERRFNLRKEAMKYGIKLSSQQYNNLLLFAHGSNT